VIAEAGCTLAPCTPLTLKLTVALGSGTPLASLSWKTMVHWDAGLTVEQELMVASALPGAVYALTRAAEASVAKAAMISDVTKRRIKREGRTKVTVVPPTGSMQRGTYHRGVCSLKKTRNSRVTIRTQWRGR
jgi:hypothetical protein